MFKYEYYKIINKKKKLSVIMAGDTSIIILLYITN